jgi:hypothetical protein
MKITLYNREQIKKAFEYTLQEFDKGFIKGANFILEPFIKDKTKEQLGFFFGGIEGAISKQKSLKPDEVKLMFYKAVAELDDTFKIEFTDIMGKPSISHKTISNMKVNEMALFIDRCLFLIDNSEYLKDVILHPSLRYSWILNLTPDDIRQVQSQVLPREDKAFLEYSRKQSCVCCGIANHSEVHHLKEAGLTGTGLKAPDWASIPLCSGNNGCHKLYHQKGKNIVYNELDYITKYVDMVTFCKIKYLRWKNKNIGY